MVGAGWAAEATRGRPTRVARPSARAETEGPRTRRITVGEYVAVALHFKTGSRTVLHQPDALIDGRRDGLGDAAVRPLDPQRLDAIDRTEPEVTRGFPTRALRGTVGVEARSSPGHRAQLDDGTRRLFGVGGKLGGSAEEVVQEDL